jgi:hypothetical protein
VSAKTGLCIKQAFSKMVALMHAEPDFFDKLKTTYLEKIIESK